ncbi:MAG: HD domain-containing phosphohydrolase [Opitutales bacterium]
MSKDKKIRILIVDDEEKLLRALKRTLNKLWDITIESDPVLAAEKLKHDHGFSVIMTDYRMPGMNGVELLRSARKSCPDTTRVMLTGYADLEATLSAINDGSVFRIITKPCDRDTVVDCLQAAVDQNQLIFAERELLNETLQGAIELLTDLQAQHSPKACKLSYRIRDLATAIARTAGLRDIWKIEIASLMSHLGLMAVSVGIADKYLEGGVLDKDEEEHLKDVPDFGSKMLKHIPRLEEAAEIVAFQWKRYDGSGVPADDTVGKEIPQGARILKIATDYIRMEVRGVERPDILNTMRHASGYYDLDLFSFLKTALDSIPDHSQSDDKARYVDVEDLQSGCVPVDGVLLKSGMVLIPAGVALSPKHLARICNFARTTGIKSPIKVYLPQDAQSPELASV